MSSLFDKVTSILLPPSIVKGSPDVNHFYRRRRTQAYLAKRSLVKGFWLLAGLAMLIQPIPAVILAITIFTTFLSFMYLDET